MKTHVDRNRMSSSKVVSAALAGTALALSGAPLVALAATPGTAAPQPAGTTATQAASTATTTATAKVTSPVVHGTFAYDQTTLTSNADIKKNFAGTDAYLCGTTAGTDEASVPLDSWNITVGGDVQNAFTESLADLADDNALTVPMGCACAGNGADQRVSANAEVTGVTFASLMREAGVSADANTVTFTSSDGYQVSLPLSYVKQRYTLLVYAINGEPLANSMGGTNQLWLGSTSARYFARDITGITFETRDAADVPAAPGTAAAGDTYANVPNVALTSSKEA